MDTTQQSQLELLIGKALTQEQIDLISPMVEDGRYPKIAEILSPHRYKTQPRMTSARGLAELVPGGPIAAEIILMKLEGARDSLLASEDQQNKVFGSLLRRQLSFLSGEGLDFGSPALHAMLDQFAVLGILTSDEVAGLKGISMQHYPITEFDIRNALGVS